MKGTTPGVILYLVSLPLLFFGIVQLAGNAMHTGIWVGMTIAGVLCIAIGSIQMRNHRNK